MRDPPQGTGLAASAMAWLGELAAVLSGLQVPQAPTRIYSTDSSVPPLPVTSFQGCVVVWSDLKTFGWCDGVHWYRADTGGVVI